MNKLLEDLELPDGAVEASASVADDSQKAGATGTPVSIDNEAEPVPTSSDSSLEEDARVEEAYRKLEILAKIEPALNDFYVRLGSMIEVTEDIKLIVGSTVARYLVTNHQVKDFEDTFVGHFDKVLLTKAKTELQTFAFELEHTRKEEVQKFNQEVKNGWWFSNKVGWFLYLSNLITLLGAFLYCFYK